MGRRGGGVSLLPATTVVTAAGKHVCWRGIVTLSSDRGRLSRSTQKTDSKTPSDKRCLACLYISCWSQNRTTFPLTICAARLRSTLLKLNTKPGVRRSRKGVQVRDWSTDISCRMTRGRPNNRGRFTSSTPAPAPRPALFSLPLRVPSASALDQAESRAPAVGSRAVAPLALQPASQAWPAGGGEGTTKNVIIFHAP